MRIGDLIIDENNPAVIAEAGVNHLGNFDYARELIEGAKKAGAAIIKFQTYKADKLTTKNAPRFWNWSGESEKDGSQYDSYSLLDKFEYEDYVKLRNICVENEIEFMSTPFDLESLDLLENLGVSAYKIASCDITNKLLISKIASKGKPIFLSTGASNLSEILTAVELIKSITKSDLCIMHCNLSYPTEPDSANLSAITHLKETFPDDLIGYSDHTLGIDIAAASVCYGSRVIEKHYTFDKNLPLSADHWLSADVEELSELVSKMNLFHKAHGFGKKLVLDSELLARENARRSIVAAREIPRGKSLTIDDLIMKRPGTGISPMFVDEILGKVTREQIEKDSIISRDWIF